MAAVAAVGLPVVTALTETFINPLGEAMEETAGLYKIPGRKMCTLAMGKMVKMGSVAAAVAVPSLCKELMIPVKVGPLSGVAAQAAPAASPCACT